MKRIFQSTWMKNCFCVGLGLIVSFAATAAPSLKPTFKHVKLKEFTELQLEILPDAGTQLIFPFVLDNPDLTPELKVRLTNSDGFQIEDEGNDMLSLVKGQNTLSIIGKYSEDPGAIHLGNLFITIGGYNLSIALKTTYDTTHAISNVIFDIDDSTRTHLIDAAIKRRTDELDKSYKERMAALDQQAQADALSHVAIMATAHPDTTNYKEEGNIELDKERVVVYADKLVNYENKYFVLLFELDNKSRGDIALDTVDLYALDGEDKEQHIAGSFNCEKRLNADTSSKCSFATQAKEIGDAPKLRLDLKTSRGQGSFVW